ncbi:uncharacterized protein UV8b_07276 [Ustilaginoidea virens]|uniref:BRCT domain-containing protein n=1 Tax=Ustilaginoidea virens TaxID=1159556 RepID=A0A8E5HWR4_USTVR|nr:uncharacterized protein UV8b_07276 [Ustilaginoidea virens]QUC23035.1 hypothetical protein UV8b_07276 [Ustilaginoidea virens]
MPSSRSAQPGPRAAPFDPWTCASTGHQVADRRPDPAWRDLRDRRLNTQLRGLPAPAAANRRTVSVLAMLHRPGLMAAAAAAATPAVRDVSPSLPPPRPRGLFAGTTVHVSGSTLPLVSDHRLRHLLAQNGATVSLRPGGRAVTHVVLGAGLAAGKQEREVRRLRSRVRYVRAEWVLESLAAGRRLPEGPFAVGVAAASGQGSVYDACK